MRGQLQPMGLSIDWSRELATCDPEYYGQQQAMFLDMLEAGLVARKSALVNWDPVDMTVLANEQVIDGKGWRSGAPVERRELTQWFFRITDMAEELLQAIDGLEAWPEKVRVMQRNWIGKSRGLQFRFRTVGAPEGFEELEVFTTRPDTLLGATFAAVSPDHPLARALEGNPEVAAFVAECRRLGTSEEELETAEKRGIDTGIRVAHPLDPELGAAGLDRQLRADGVRDGRGLRLPGARPARPGLRAQVRAAGHRRLCPARVGRAGRQRGLRAAEVRDGGVPAPAGGRAADDRRGGGGRGHRLLRGDGHRARA